MDAKRQNSRASNDLVLANDNVGWSHDPDSAARYALAVTFEILGHEISIQEPLRTAVIELEAEVEREVEAEIQVEE